MTWHNLPDPGLARGCLLPELSPSAPWAEFSELEAFVQRVYPLLVRVKFRRGIIQGLSREHTLRDQIVGAIQGDLVIDQRGFGFVEIVLGLLNFFRARSILQFLKVSPRVICSA